MDSPKYKLLPNPREKANIFSILFFSWTLPLFKKGYSKVLELEDLFQPLSADRSELLGNRLERNWKKQLERTTQPSLIWAIFRTFWKEYIVLSVVCFLNDVFVRLMQPYLLGCLLRYFRKDSQMSHKEAMVYAAGIVVFNAISALLISQCNIVASHNGMKVRVSVCSIIYRKALRLSQTALGETASGKVVNLISNDMNRFYIVSLFMNAIWTAPLVGIIVSYFLWINVGVAGLIGIIVVFIVVLIQSYTGKLSAKFRLQTALRTDERVRFVDEIISGAQVIKMYAWEKPFAQLITFARRMELKIVRRNSYVRALFLTFALFTTRMALFVTMVSIVFLSSASDLKAEKIFVVSSYFGIIANTMSLTFVRGVAEIAEALVSVKRLQSFLEKEEKSIGQIEHNKNSFDGDGNEKQKLLEAENLAPRNVSVSFKNATARWRAVSKAITQNGTTKLSKDVPSDDVDDWKTPTLQNINVDFPKGKLIGIVGPVGAGKSSFLQALLHELPLESGSISINGTLSYACQEPWVFAGTVRQNILFGQEMDRERYDAVVKACALVKDFEQLEHGDRTLIGERGASLSGGQKARINLARAVYRRADIYLFDDPLSAVDAHVGRHLFSQCFGPKSRLARQKVTRILVTHQVHFLNAADWIVILRDGKIEVQGSPSDLARSGIDFATLINAEERLESEDSFERSGKRSRTESRSSNRSISSTSLCSVHDEVFEEVEEENDKNEGMQMEASSKGQIKGSVPGNYFKAGAHWSGLAFLFLLFLIVQVLASGADYWVSFWTNQEELRSYRASNQTQVVRNETIAMNNATEVNDTATPDFDQQNSPLLSTEMCIYIHGSIIIALFIIALCRSVGFYVICVRASQKLHDSMFHGLISTTVRFFDTNPSGRILNRFSKDMGAMDEFLPKAMLDASQIILNLIGAIIVTSIVNPIVMIPIVVMAFIFVFIRKIYLKTSKNIKRLEGITKSPVFTHLASTLNGLSTIRANNAEAILEHEFDNHQDTHSACWYMFVATSSAFGLSLDFMCVVFVFCVTFSSILINTGISGDKVGLAITQAMGLTGLLQWGIRQSAEVTNQMMSVERVLEYRDLPPEKQPEKPFEVAKTWPLNGRIEFRNVIYKYSEDAEPVLRSLSFIVQPMEKIGIVGRTGAGKSSLIGSLFRLAIVEGEILIDDVNTATLRLSDLRSRIAIIPQDPVLFSGTLRRNLDPFEEYPDSDIWSALEEVELKEIANGPLGLQWPVMAHGSNFSVGQRQLLCLARAILRKNRILVLDEATANVDPQTDSLIQKTIRVKFAECTVLTIAHRLHTIIDSDRVLVMDTGRAVEFDEPYRLIQQETGIFKDMIKALGSQELDRLTNMALEKFNSKRKIA